PEERHLVAQAALDLEVEAVVGEVRLAAHEPGGVRLVPLEHPLPRLEPVELPGRLAPERLRIVERLAVEALVLLQVGEVRFARQGAGGSEPALLLRGAVDAVGHGTSRAAPAPNGTGAEARAGGGASERCWNLFRRGVVAPRR